MEGGRHGKVKYHHDFGAEVPFLRMEAADDQSPSSQATVAALIQAENHWKKKFDVVAQLMANCPLRTATDIQGAVKAFQNSQTISQISSVKFGWMNPWWATKLDDAGNPVDLFPGAKNTRSQDLPPLYCPTGAIWLTRRESLLQSKSFYVDGHTYHVLPWVSSLDIDDADDFDMAKAAYLLRYEIKQ